MEKEQVQKVLDELQKQPKRKFSQSYDLIINLKNINIKSNPVDLFVTLHFPKGRKVKVAAFIDQELLEQASKFCDLALKESDFEKYKNDTKAQKRLADGYDYFIAQANLMPKIAGVFGKVLGIKGKMPNPKLGCVIPPSANVEQLVKKLNLTVRLSAKKGLNLQCMVGKEDQPVVQIIDNVQTIYQTVLKHLPEESQNIKNASLKLTMGKPVRLE